MPFDVLEKPKLACLSDVLTHLGITPVSMQVLEAHKKAQVRANPPSLLLNPKFYLGLWLLQSIGLYATTSDPIHASVLEFSTDVGVSACVAIFTTAFSWMMIMVIGGVTGAKVRTKAIWQEHSWPSSDTPDTIREMIYAIQKLAPWTTVLYGELTQSHVVLDPYVVVQRTIKKLDNTFVYERHCLGIWDGAKIIALADWQRN